MKSQNLYQNAEVPNNQKCYPRSVGRFFSTRDSSLKIEQLYRQSEVRVFPLGTDCDTPYFRLASASARIVGVRSEQSRTVPQAVTVRSIPPGTHSPRVVLCSSVLTLRVRARLGGLRVYFSAGLNWSTSNVARS